MPRLPVDAAPQIVAILPLSTAGAFVLVKAARKHLGLTPGDGLSVGRLDHGEIRVRRAEDPGQSGQVLPVDRRGKVVLPQNVLAHLGAPQPAHVALVERPGGAALKAFTVDVVEGDHVAFVDIETPRAITRRVVANPLPETALPVLASRLKGLAPSYDVEGYLRGRDSLHAWVARGTLGCPDPGDDALRDVLIQQRVGRQHADGAWGEPPYQVIQTARVLRELADLQVRRESEAIRRGAAWLLARPVSEYNPGQWFLTDDLVERQATVIGQRQAMKHGTRPRFRELRRPETAAVMSGEDLVRAPCGPRIMWPTALVLDALLPLGYEEAPRVQTVLDFLIAQDWCECAYQHGLADRGEACSYQGDRLTAFEALCQQEYRLAGQSDADTLFQRDLAHPPLRFLRSTCETVDGVLHCALTPDLHVQGCEFTTTRALASVKHQDMRRFAEAHLWRFAGCQLSDGRFPRERHGTGFGQLGILAAFARYAHHPAARVVLLRAVPWLLEAQRPDGSWDEPVGSGKRRESRLDAATRAAVSVLKAVEGFLPAL